MNFANFLTDQKRPFHSETEQKHCVDEKGLTDNRGRLEVGSQREWQPTCATGYLPSWQRASPQPVPQWYKIKNSFGNRWEKIRYFLTFPAGF